MATLPLKTGAAQDVLTADPRRTPRTDEATPRIKRSRRRQARHAARLTVAEYLIYAYA